MYLLLWTKPDYLIPFDEEYAFMSYGLDEHLHILIFTLQLSHLYSVLLVKNENFHME